jgi:hypothetical protein
MMSTHGIQKNIIEKSIQKLKGYGKMDENELSPCRVCGKRPKIFIIMGGVVIYCDNKSPGHPKYLELFKSSDLAIRAWNADNKKMEVK